VTPSVAALGDTNPSDATGQVPSNSIYSSVVTVSQTEFLFRPTIEQA